MSILPKFSDERSLLEAIKAEAMANGNLSIRGVARLAEVDHKSIISSGDFKSLKLSQKLVGQGFEAGDLVENGFPPQAVVLVLAYFGYDSKVQSVAAKTLLLTFGTIGLVKTLEQLAKPNEQPKPANQPQLSLHEAREFIADFRLNHDLAVRSGNMRLQQLMEVAIQQYTEVYVLAGMPIQPLINGKPVGTVNIRYEGCVDVAIRLGLKIPSNYEQALGRYVKSKVAHLLIKTEDGEVKDYRTAACSGKRLSAAMYEAFHPEVEQAVKDFCQSKSL